MRRLTRGQTLVEYGLLLSLIFIIVIVVLLFSGPIVSAIFKNAPTPTPSPSASGSPAAEVRQEGQTYRLIEPQQVVIDGYVYELVSSDE